MKAAPSLLKTLNVTQQKMQSLTWALTEWGSGTPPKAAKDFIKHRFPVDASWFQEGLNDLNALCRWAFPCFDASACLLTRVFSSSRSMASPLTWATRWLLTTPASTLSTCSCTTPGRRCGASRWPARRNTRIWSRPASGEVSSTAASA